jgi:type IV pilus assembly protein PilM
MITELFLPEKFRNRRLIAQRILGIALQDDTIYGAFVHAKPAKTVIQALVSCSIENANGQTYEEKVSDALRNCFSQVGKYDQVRICVPASIVIFKELQVPFLDVEKIRMVLEYEVENMLPFSIDEAITDFIITKKNHDQQSSQVFVAAVRKHDLKNILDPFLEAGIDPNAITIDLFALYSLYLQIEEYKTTPHGTALVDISQNSTRIAFLQDGEFRLTRHIQRGITTVAKSISDEINMPISEVLQRLYTSGVEYPADEEYQRSAQKQMSALFNDIQFTLNSFSLKLNYYEGIQKILFAGKGTDVKNLIQFCGNLLQIPCQQFDSKKLLKEKWVVNKVAIQPTSWNPFAIALGITLPAPLLETFDLRRKEFTKIYDQLLFKQLICASILLVFFLTFLGVRGYQNISYLSGIVSRIEIREKRRLQSIFPKDKLPKRPTLQNLVKESSKLLQESNALWAPFTKDRLKPLEMLEEITNIIDKKKYPDVTITYVSIAPSKEGITFVKIEGYFKAPIGQPLWENFAQFKNRFEESPLFTLAQEIDDSPAEERGIPFTAKLKPRDK